ncbi:hypothetical protein BDV19DRAFT_395368 [Aspergillus venezuelensis]
MNGQVSFKFPYYWLALAIVSVVTSKKSWSYEHKWTTLEAVVDTYKAAYNSATDCLKRKRQTMKINETNKKLEDLNVGEKLGRVAGKQWTNTHMADVRSLGPGLKPANVDSALLSEAMNRCIVC